MASVHLTGYIRQSIHSTTSGLLCRHEIAKRNEFPFELDKHLYAILLGDMADKLKEVEAYPYNFLHVHNTVYITVPDVSNASFELTLDDMFPLPDKAPTWSFRPEGRVFNIEPTSYPQLYVPLRDWVEGYMQTVWAIDAARDVVHHILESCVTAGQLRKVWPEMIPFLDDYIQAKLGRTVSRVMPHVEPEILEKLPSAKTLLAAGVMLPDKEHGDKGIEVKGAI